MLSSLLLVLPVASLAVAEGYGSSPSATESASGAVQTIWVGSEEGDMTFSPESVNVEVGDKVEFVFYPGNHAVGQSTFDSPCQPLDDDSFYSGIISRPNGIADTSFTITVTNSDPIWYYCPTGRHCQAGMVGVINPPREGDTIEQFKAKAQEAGPSSVSSKVQGGTVGEYPSSSSSEPESASASSAEASATSTEESAAAGRLVTWQATGLLALLAAIAL